MMLLKERLLESFRKQSHPLEPVPTGEESHLKRLNGIRFVIFDFYGTIFLSGVGDIGIDDASAGSRDFTGALTACGLSLDDRDNTETVFENGYQFFLEVLEKESSDLIKKGYDPPEPEIEIIWLQVLQKLSEMSLVTGAVSMERAQVFAVEYEARINPSWPVPGLSELLGNLRSGPLQYGIISNSQFYTPLLFEALTGNTLVESGFNEHLLHWSFEEKVKKPAVMLYENFLKKLLVHYPDATPGEVLYVGNDMLKDIYPASVTGMKTVLYAGDKRSLKWRKNHELCRDLKPDIVITDIRRLTECL